VRSVQKARSASLFALLAALACTPAKGGDTTADPEGARSAGAEATQVPTSRAAPAAPRPSAGHAWVIFGADTVVAEVASTPDQRAQGLMYRDAVTDGTGMLFVFEDNALRSFWMQNTYVALDIAFLDPSFRVVDIQQMEPLTTDPHASVAPAMFALEVRKGWFAEKGIATGVRAEVVFGLQ